MRRHHKPISLLRWQMSQRHLLSLWNRRNNLDQEQHKRETLLLPILQRYARQYPEEGSLLEIGCGPICLSQQLPQQQKTYIDPLIDDFRRMFPGQLPEGELLATTAERIEKPSASIDLIICLNSLAYTLNPELIINEIERLLKSDGRLILAIRIHSSMEARLHYLAERFLPVFTRKTRPYYYALRGIRSTLNRHFKIEQEIPLSRGIFGITLFKREQWVFVCSPLANRPRRIS